MGRRQARTVVVRALHDVAVDARRLQAVQLRSMQRLLQGGSAVEPVRGGVRISQRPRRVQLVRHVATTVPTHAHSLRGHADRTVLMIAATSAVAVHVLSLKFVLNALAVRRVSYQRQDRPDTLHEESPLTRLRVIESSLEDDDSVLDNHLAKRVTYLDAVVAVRVAQKLLQPRAVQQLPNEHLASAMFRDPNALQGDIINTLRASDQPLSTNLLNDVGTELLDGQRADIASKLADDGIAEAIVVQVKDILHDLGASTLHEQTRNITPTTGGSLT